MAGKKRNLDPMWKILMKDVDLGERTSFLDHVSLGCTQRECKTSKDIVTITGICSNPGFQSELNKNYLIQRNLKQTFPHGPMT